MANKTNFFVVSLIAMMAVAPAVADTPATQEWTKGRYDTAMQTINSRLATDVRDKIYNYDTNKNSPTYRQILDPLNTEAETAFSGINEVLQKVDGNNGTANSAVTLETTAQNAFGAINELKDAIDNIDIPEQVQADWEATTGKAAILHKPEIPEAQIQSDWAQNDNTKVDFIKNKPTLATVATSGSYNDLTDKPAAQDLTGYATETYVDTQIGELDIPAAQVQSDWTATEGMGVILHKPTLANVATSGAYSDLSGTPDLSGYATTQAMNTALVAKANSADLATVATSGSYNDLEDKPQIPAAQVQSDWTATEGMGVILHKPTLATVATTGAYSDLSGTPDLTGYATTQAMNTALADKADDADLTALETRVETAEGKIGTGNMSVGGNQQSTIVAAINALDAKTTGIATQGNLETLESSVTALSNTVGSASGGLVKDVADNTSAISDIETELASKADAADLADYVQSSDLATVATTGDYDDLTNKPAIPTVDNALNTQSSNAIANSAVAGKIVASNVPGSGQYVLGYVEGVPTYIAIVGAD